MVKISNGARVLYQWERGVKLTVTGQCDIVRMSREDDSGAKDFVPYKNGVEKEVEVPDFLLTESGYLRVSIIIRENDTERILETARFVIRPMQKSNNLAMSEQDVGSWLVLKMRMDALERAAREGKFNGDDGITPHIGENGNWYLGDVDTGVKATGEDGITPHIGENGNWFIGDIDTGVKALGEDGITPNIGENGNWYLGETDTGVKATGDDGITPHIGGNGNWYLGETDTGVKATGDDGITPHIGENGNWYIGDTDTGIKASGIHVGTKAPTNGETVWIDTDEEPEENDSTQIDVIAQPGQIIAVKEVDANGKPTKWEAIDLPKAKEPETPDFSANEGEAGYIENRTHYIDEKGVIHKLPNMYIDAEWMATKEDGGAGQTVFIPEQTLSSGMWSNLQQDLIEGDAYSVEVNGLTYKCVCQNNGSMLYLGNGTLFGATEHNNEPFCISWVSGATGGLFYRNDNLSYPIGIKVSDWLDEIYNKLPKEFMPDISFEELTDKPFVEGMGELLYSQTVTFDTDNDSVKLAKISLTPKLDVVYWMDINGVLHKCHWEKSGVSYDLYDTDGNKWMQNNILATYLYGQTAGTYTYNLYESSEIQMLDPKYIPANVAKKSDIPTGGGTGGTSIDVTAEVGQTIVVKEVDANGKPTKWESVDYQPRTHWMEETVILLPEQELVFSEEIGFAAQIDSALEVGKNYIVRYNGGSYTCKCVNVKIPLNEDGTEFVLLPSLGNVDLFMGIGDTGEPFFVGDMTGYGMQGTIVVEPLDGAENVSVYIAEVEYHQIPKQYIIENVPFRFTVTQSEDDYNVYTSTVTVKEMEKAYKSGRYIIGELTVIGMTFYLPMSICTGNTDGHREFDFAVGSNSMTMTPKDDGTYSITTKVSGTEATT